MLDVFSDVIIFRGSHYDFGYKQGRELLHSPILKHRKKLWGPRKDRHFLINYSGYKNIINRFFPAMWEELQGLADGLQWSMKQAIVEFGGYYLEYGQSGCSVLTTDRYMVRNYDNHPKTYEGRYVLYQPTDTGYATLGPSMQITGRTDGMNEKGLALGYNFINRRQSKDGFVCNMIGRMVLERCQDTDEAVDLLKAIPHRHSFSYVLLDAKGQSIIVEASPRQVVARKGHVCTNHFLQLKDENRYRMEESLARKEAIQTQKEQATDPLSAFNLLNDPKKGIFSHNYGAYAGTLHTALYLPKEKRAGIALGGHRLPLIFQMDDFLSKKQINIKQIKGKIRSSTAFINV